MGNPMSLMFPSLISHPGCHQPLFLWPFLLVETFYAPTTTYLLCMETLQPTPDAPCCAHPTVHTFSPTVLSLCCGKIQIAWSMLFQTSYRTSQWLKCVCLAAPITTIASTTFSSAPAETQWPLNFPPLRLSAQNNYHSVRWLWIWLF